MVRTAYCAVFRLPIASDLLPETKAELVPGEIPVRRTQGIRQPEWGRFAPKGPWRKTMARKLLFLIAILAAGAPAGAQPRFYGGGSVAADAGARGPVDVGTFPAAGGLVGWRFSKHWSLEFHLDRGFGEGDPRTFEGLLLAQQGGPLLERSGVFGRSVWQERPKAGWAALAVYATRQPGRVDFAVYGGVSERRFEERHVTTITSVGPDVTWPPDHPNLRNRDEQWTVKGGGLTGGVLVPVKLADQITVAPEIRVTLGIITDESTYKQFYSGVRVMWGF